MVKLNYYNMMDKEILEKIESLEAKLSGDMFADMEIKEEIHKLKMQINGTKPDNSEIECVGCGS